jgi:MFS family permease
MTQSLPAPNAQRFAVIGGVESFARGTTVSVFPLVMYHAWGNAAIVSQIYFVVGFVSLLTALLVPWLTRVFTRRPIYIFSAGLYVVGAGFGALGGKFATAALLCCVMAAAISFVCFNAYVLDNLEKSEFGRLETLRLFYSGSGWVVGPVMGVWLMTWWEGAPFVMVAAAALVMLTLILRTPLGRGKAIIQSPGRSSNPLAHVHRFFSQPRLVTAWLIPLARSCGWWFYFVYIGIFAVEQGLGDQVGGIAASVANMGLFLTPLMLQWMQRHSVRIAVRTGFLFAGLCFIGAALLSVLPWVTVAILIVGTCFLVLLDTSGALPFMMAVKPSERTEMSAVYSSFRDASGIISPAIAWVVLQYFPVAGVFAACGLLLLAAWLVAARLHPQLGIPGASRKRHTLNA